MISRLQALAILVWVYTYLKLENRRANNASCHLWNF